MLFGIINQAVFDWPWSGIHLVSGVVVGMILVFGLSVQRNPAFWSFGLAVLVVWELTEITLRLLDVHAHDAVAPFKQAVSGFAFAPETAANVVGDLAIGSLGLWIGNKLGKML